MAYLLAHLRDWLVWHLLCSGKNDVSQKILMVKRQNGNGGLRTALDGTEVAGLVAHLHDGAEITWLVTHCESSVLFLGTGRSFLGIWE